MTRNKKPLIFEYFTQSIACFFIVLLLFLMSSCKTSSPDGSVPELTFKHRPPVHLNVAHIEIINEYKMPFETPNVEHLVPISPGASAERWASDILKAVGDKHAAEFVITSGPVVKKDLKIKKGLEGVFSIDQSKQFTAKINVRLNIFEGNKKMATVKAAATRSHTLREDASPNLKTRLWYNLVEKLMQSFDSEIRSQIDSHLKKYIP